VHGRILRIITKAATNQPTNQHLEFPKRLRAKRLSLSGFHCPLSSQREKQTNSSPKGLNDTSRSERANCVSPSVQCAHSRKKRQAAHHHQVAWPVARDLDKCKKWLKQVAWLSKNKRDFSHILRVCLSVQKECGGRH
jgi:hypothetical protein